MAAKYFCDVCSLEIGKHHDRLRRQKGKVMVEVMVRYENTWNAGHVCEKCVTDVVLNGRPTKSDESYVATA